MIKVLIRNCVEDDECVSPYDYKKFKNGRIIEFDDVKALENLLNEAKEIHYDDYSCCDWVDVGLTIENGIFIIYIRKEYSRD